jgi:hypothetical protein
MLDHDINKRLLGITHSQPMDDTASPPFVFFTPSIPHIKKRKLLTLESDDYTGDDNSDEQ